MIKLRDILGEIDIRQHLQDRGIDFDKTRVIVDDENDAAYFFLYTLTGKLVGYQRYNPSGSKAISGNRRQSDVDLSLLKYKTFRGHGEISVYGIETYDMNSKYLFVVEGIFDCIKIHNAGYPAIATLSNDPTDSTKSWLKTLPQEIIVVADKDKAGQKLAKTGHRSVSVPDPYKDLGEMPQDQVNAFLQSIVKN